MAVVARTRWRWDKNGSVWRRPGQTLGGTTPPPQPPETAMLYGTTQYAYGQLQTALHGVNAAATMRIRRFYENAIPSSWSGTGMVSDYNATPRRASWVSYSDPSVSTVLSAGFTATLASFFASIPADHRVLFTWKHEANNKSDEKLGGATRAQFRDAQKKIWEVKEANAQTPANISVGIILTAEPYRLGTADEYSAPAGYCDFLGADPYRFWRDTSDPSYLPDPKTNGPGSNRTMAYLIGDGLAHGQGMPQLAETYGVPVALGEYGAHPRTSDHTSRPLWLQETHDYLTNLRAGCLAAIYFHSPRGESGPWWLDRYHTYTVTEGDALRDNGAPDPTSLNKWAALVASQAA